MFTTIAWARQFLREEFFETALEIRSAAGTSDKKSKEFLETLRAVVFPCTISLDVAE